ncbi:putative endonuclease [Leptolyngbya sp. Heron Island J]|uniref:helix-turn-helix domain-containing protein n=1 Tax=Leptolyngbya sp. Heron Island J TaxID=1385935 RepID=UPI0003B9D0F0|nr:helix-turn-helix domain-containing protein [Leptolyngbya sp. Heron Island J]ESA38479.1 putative endonuclease [Leptolyngbya sp. Heron Island J]
MIGIDSLNLGDLPTVDFERKNALPSVCGVYLAIDSSNKVQYVGKAKSIKDRWDSHEKAKELEASNKIAYIRCSYRACNQIEADLISFYQPKLNKSFTQKEYFNQKPKTTLNWNFRFIFNRQKKSVADIAKASGLTKSKIQNFVEMENCPNISTQVLHRLCISLDCQPGDLISIEYEDIKHSQSVQKTKNPAEPRLGSIYRYKNHGQNPLIWSEFKVIGLIENSLKSYKSLVCNGAADYALIPGLQEMVKRNSSGYTIVSKTRGKNSSVWNARWAINTDFLLSENFQFIDNSSTVP